MSFENIKIEHITYCPIGSYSGGVKAKMYYAPADYFFYTPYPVPKESYSSEIIVSEEILMKKDKLLSSCDILIDENELKSTLDGAKGRKKTKTSVSFFIVGFTTLVLGFIERLANVPMILFLEDSNGNIWQIGHLRNRVFIETADSSTGKKYEDNSGVSIIATCNSSLLLYPYSLQNMAKPGDFNNDFNNDFYKKEI